MHGKSKSFLIIVSALIVMSVLLIQSTSALRCVKDETITVEVKHEENLSQAVSGIIRSLNVMEKNRNTASSVTSIIKVTSSTVDDIIIKQDDLSFDLFLKILHSHKKAGLFESHNIRDNDQFKSLKTTKQHNNVLLIVSNNAISNREMEELLLLIDIESSRTMIIVVHGKSINDIKLMLNIMWRKKFLHNVLIVSLATNEKNGNVAASIFKPSAPFVEDFCGQVHPVVVRWWQKSDFSTIRNFRNFHLCPIRVAIFQAPPYMLIQRRLDGEINDIHGIDGNILKILAKKFNFTVEYVFVSDDIRWGEIRADLTSTGALNLVSFFHPFHLTSHLLSSPHVYVFRSSTKPSI